VSVEPGDPGGTPSLTVTTTAADRHSLPEGATTATITSTTQMFRPVSGGAVRAVAVPLHRGRTMVTAQTSLYDAQERLVAQTTQIQVVR